MSKITHKVIYTSLSYSYNDHQEFNNNERFFHSEDSAKMFIENILEFAEQKSAKIYEVSKHEAEMAARWD
jgi:hypothetical protein